MLKEIAGDHMVTILEPQTFSAALLARHACVFFQIKLYFLTDREVHLYTRHFSRIPQGSSDPSGFVPNLR
jgi:hypothetical protein